jgi:hypothetical protein
MANSNRRVLVIDPRSFLTLAAIAVVCVSLLVGCEEFTCDETAERSATASAAGIDTVRVIAEAGSLDLEGKAGLTEINMDGTACAGNTGDLSEIQFEVSTSGSEVLIEARTPSGSSRFDVRIDVPDSVLVEIDDGSGEIRVRDVAAVRITDGSGEVDVAGVTGDLVVADDGSGDLDLRGVTGSVDVNTDGSGDILISGVDGDVRIGTDGSGSIDVSDVGGDFTVGSDGSGTIDYTDIAGSVDIPD